MKSRFIGLSAVALVGVLFLTGCPPKKKLEIEKKADESVTESTATAKGNETTEPGIEITQDWTEIPALATVNFGYDLASFDDSARSALKNNVAILKKLPTSVTIRVEGHCDDRGTVEYNIALGQRRANAVRSYYVTAGLPKSRIETISFGEERPICTEQTDDCWARNRRGVTKVRNAETIKLKPESLQ